MNLMDEKSNVHTIDKVIDLNVRKRKKSSRHSGQKKKKRRGDQFSLYDDGDLYGSGDGSGDGYGNEISRGVLYKHDYGLIKWIKITNAYKVPSQLVEGRLLKLFTTGFWSKLWLLISKSPPETEAEGEGL